MPHPVLADGMRRATSSQASMIQLIKKWLREQMSISANDAIRAANPIWEMRDLTGNHLDDTYYLFILENNIPYLPATTWQDANRNVPWSNPIQFLANGTLPQNIFYSTGTTYRLEVRAGNTQNAQLIYLIENFVAGASGGSTPSGAVSITADNQITNPQFALVNFQSPFTVSSVTNPAPIDIAPGWQLVLTGTGSYTLTQDKLNSGDAEPTNASFALNFNLSGWTTAKVVQRFENNGVLWSGLYVNALVSAKQLSGTSSAISSQLVPSTGTPTALFSGNLTSAYNIFSASSPIPISTNTDFPPDAYIDFEINIPSVGITTLTSFQLISSDVSISLSYEQDTIARQIDHTYHLDRENILGKIEPSYLTGWDFPLNPFQFRDKALTARTTAEYICDQTICKASGNSFSSGLNSDSSLLLQANSGGQSLTIYQYLTGGDVAVFNHNVLSSLVSARSTNGGETVRVSLYGSTATAFPTIPDVVVDANPDGTFNSPIAGWEEIATSEVDQQFKITTLEKGYLFKKYSGTSDFNKFCIAVSFGNTVASDFIVIKSISLNKGVAATAPAPLTASQTLQDCQYYYEKSYSPGVLAGAVTDAGLYMREQTLSHDNVVTSGFAKLFSLEYRIIKATSTPVIVLFNPSVLDSAGFVRFTIRNGLTLNQAVSEPITSWNVFNLSGDNINYLADNLTAIVSIAFTSATSVQIEFHYTVSARLGIEVL